MTIDPILAIWLFAVALWGLWNAYWGVIEWQTGVANIAFWPRVSRSLQPAAFAVAVAGRLLGTLAAAALFLFALVISNG